MNGNVTLRPLTNACAHPRHCRAGWLLRNDLASGRLALQAGEAKALPYGREKFDRMLTCQTVYLWSDVCGGLAELHRVLAGGGSCAWP